MSEPRDLHELLAALGPESGWRMMMFSPGLIRTWPGELRGLVIEPDGPGVVLIHGSPKDHPETTFFHRLPIGEVPEWLKSKEEM